jgi:hypothetical protein
MLECGSRDLERLSSVFAIAEKFGITVDDVIVNAEGNGRVKFNDLMYTAMKMILDKIADILDTYKRSETAEKLRKWDVYVNYLDSWFNIEALDSLDEGELEELTPEEVAVMVAEELEGEMGSFDGADVDVEDDEKVLELVRKNYWLSGMAEAEEGDPLAGLENAEMFAKVTPVEDPSELWKYIENYQGIFRYRNLYFANHTAYGCFVYIVKAGEAKEFEHITFEKYEDFKKWLFKVLSVNDGTDSVSEFYEKYYNG